MTIEEIEDLISKHGSITAQPLRDLVVTVVLEAVEAEREACAEVCEETTAAWTQHLYNSGCVDCAAAIRNRGKQE